MQAIQSQQKIAQTQAELNARKRDLRLNQLTSSELSALSKDTPVYEGVGKMSVDHSVTMLLVEADHTTRFVAVPVDTLNKRLTKESGTWKKEVADLEKKLHYQETTFKNSRKHIEKILHGGRSGS